MKRKAAIFLFLVFMIFLPDLFTFLTFAAGEYDCPSGKHKYTDTIITNPTQSKDGEIKHTCDLCGHFYVQIMPAAGHQWGEWIIDKEPSCALPGQRHRDCTATALTHSEYAETAPLGHEYSEAVKEPSCTQDGAKTYTCSRCGHSYTQPFGQAFGHKYHTETIAPDAKDKEGALVYRCDLCGDSYDEPLPSHQYEITEEIKAGCGHDGQITYTCKIYGDTYSEFFPATGHNWGEWITDERENLTHTGHKYRICGHDGSHVEHQSIPAGITMEITPAAIAVNTGSLILAVVSAGILFGEYSVLSRERKARKKRTELMKNGGAKLEG